MINNTAVVAFTILTFVSDIVILDRFTKANISWNTNHDSELRPNHDGHLKPIMD